MEVSDFQKYVEEHTWVGKDIYFTSNALGGELGELQNVIKKEQAFKDFERYAEKVRKEIEAGTRPTFREHFVDEAGDVLFYFLQLLNKKGVTIEEVIEGQTKKIDDLSESYGHSYKK